MNLFYLIKCFDNLILIIKLFLKDQNLLLIKDWFSIYKKNFKFYLIENSFNNFFYMKLIKF